MAKVLTGGYQEIEPVSVADVTDVDILMKILREALSRGNPILESYSYAENKEVAVLKYVGIKSYSTFVRQSETWHVVIKNDQYEIRGQRRRPDRGWEPDEEKTLILPVGSSQEDLVQRIAGILEESAVR